jgi:GNAT superfamily N-acetyltransferase
VSRVAAGVDVRPYGDADEPAVLALLNESLGGGPAGARPAEFFRWKHLENPFGRSYMLVAESDDRIVGLRAFMRWEFVAGERRFRAVRAVDTATHPDYQGRGIFSRLTLESLDTLRDQADFVYNTPNEKSLPGYLKMGWKVVGRVPIRIRVRRPIRFAMRVRSWRSGSELGDAPAVRAAHASALLDDRIDRLLSDGERAPGLATPRDGTFLRWRYGVAPLLDYRALTTVGNSGGVDGLAIFRVRPRGTLVEATLAEAIVRRGDRRAARKLLRSVATSARVDEVACSFPPGSSPDVAARRLGAVHAPGGMTLVVNPLGHDLDPDPLDPRSWALTVGDLEVF